MMSMPALASTHGGWAPAEAGAGPAAAASITPDSHTGAAMPSSRVKWVTSSRPAIMGWGGRQEGSWIRTLRSGGSASGGQASRQLPLMCRPALRPQHAGMPRMLLPHATKAPTSCRHAPESRPSVKLVMKAWMRGPAGGTHSSVAQQARPRLERGDGTCCAAHSTC